MEQYIKKSASKAEINQRIEDYKSHKIDDSCHDGLIFALEDLRDDFINTQEVDLEKEIKEHIKECLNIKFPTTDVELIKKDVAYTAKKFFELGLQARTDKELVEEIYSHIDSIKDIADRMTSGNFMHNKAAIKFSANTIAKVLELIGLKAQKGE